MLSNLNKCFPFMVLDFKICVRDVLHFPGMYITILKVIQCYLILAEDKMGRHVHVATGVEANWEIPAPFLFDGNMYSWLVVIQRVMMLV